MPILSSLCALALGCASHPATQPPLQVLLGGATDDGLAFVDWSGCPPAKIVHGVQGGQHVWGSVRIHGLVGPRARIRVSLFHIDGAPVEPGGTEISPKPDPSDYKGPDGQGGWQEEVGFPIFIEGPCVLASQKLTARATVFDDETGGNGQASGCIQPFLDPAFLEWNCAAK